MAEQTDTQDSKVGDNQSTNAKIIKEDNGSVEIVGKMDKSTQDRTPEKPEKPEEKVDEDNSQADVADATNDKLSDLPGSQIEIKNNSDRFGSTASVKQQSNKFRSSNMARVNWKKATRAAVMTQALNKVTVENKVGTKAEELDDDDELKVIALALQRSLRDFGRLHGASVKDLSSSSVSPTLEGTQIGDNSFSYEATANKSNYKTYQPQFSCTNMHSECFHQIRQSFNMLDSSYFASVGLQDNRKESNYYVISSKDASGKSVSFFFLSPDQRIIFKLCTNADVKSIDKIIDHYKDHVESCKFDRGNKTLLPCIYGMYALQFSDPGIPSVVLMAQKNFFASGYKIHKKYDLKGSTHNRLASEKEKAKKSPCFKDLDWLCANEKLRFQTKEQVNNICEQLRKDSLFLSRHDLIDYSLLVGIHNKDMKNLDLYNRRLDPFDSSVTASDKDNSYKYYGIVDILTPYTTRKSLETFFMGDLFCGRDISCQPPPAYQKRFVQFCSEHILASDED